MTSVLWGNDVFLATWESLYSTVYRLIPEFSDWTHLNMKGFSILRQRLFLAVQRGLLNSHTLCLWCITITFTKLTICFSVTKCQEHHLVLFWRYLQNPSTIRTKKYSVYCTIKKSNPFTKSWLFSIQVAGNVKLCLLVWQNNININKDN